MKKNILTISCFLFLFCTSCVQKTYTKTVVFLLNVSNINEIKTVGIRGNNKPLSWDYNFEMKAFNGDTLYKATVTFITGYKFAETKFVVNDVFELQEQSNRRINFSDKDTTVYMARFNVVD
jgi:hypothetical protein